MSLLRAHLAAVAVIVAAVAVMGGVFLFARPQYHPYVMPPPPDHGLSYTRVTWDAHTAQAAFAAQGIHVVHRSTTKLMVDMSNAPLTVEVTVFGDPEAVAAAGFYDYTTDSDGHYVHWPASCTRGSTRVEYWAVNVRILANCPVAPGVRAAVAALR